jgi:hypothetical protein
MSRWLAAYLFLSVPCVFVPALLIEMRHNGGHFVQAYRAIGNPQGAAYRVAALLAFVDLAVLAWYTFFTDCERVADADKSIVVHRHLRSCALRGHTGCALRIPGILTRSRALEFASSPVLPKSNPA